jgi:1-acyl-sn-glycerol-3-phosphate acyltransferase
LTDAAHHSEGQPAGLARRAKGVVRGLALGGTLYGALVGTSVALLPFKRHSPSEQRVVRHIVRRLIPTSLFAGGITLHVSGRERLADPSLARGYVLVANHASNLDPLALMHALEHYHLCFVAKAETFRRPLLGRIIDALPWLPVERESLAALKKLVGDVRQRQAEGWVPQIVVFPEGTRSEDGTLAPFKIGPFMLAAQLGIPILPVILRGTYELHKKNAFMVYPGHVHVDIKAPLPVPPLTGHRELAVLDAAAALKKSTEAIFHAVPELRGQA